MNTSLLNPFNIIYPTAVQASLPSQCSLARFDRSGRFVAAGRSDGSAAIWDLETRASVRWLEGHVKGITSVDWSRNSRFVLTSSKDWNVIVWDLASDIDPPQRKTTIRFDAPASSASFHPRNSQIILTLLQSGDAYLVDLRKKHRGRVELEEVQDDSDDESGASSRSAMTVAQFDTTGRHIFVGTSTGSVLVFNTRTKTMVARHKIAGAGAMKGLDFAKSGRRLVTNSSDRTLRQFTLPTYSPPNADREYMEQELEPTHKFSDPINRVAWHAMSFSPDGEWLAGGAADPASHKIYIWDIANDGQLASTLDGGREPLIYVHVRHLSGDTIDDLRKMIQWHPSKPSIVSTTNHGNILIWHCPAPERWGAFAGGFEEVDENVEYEEREDEFDIEDENVLAERKMKQEEEEVDVLTGKDAEEEIVDHPRVSGDEDDFAWADDEPDEDTREWKMKIMMEDESDMI